MRRGRAVSRRFAYADDANRAKARSLVEAAIQLTNSIQAVKMLWQATDIDPTYNEAYVYLGLFYNSREDFPKVVEVYKKFAKYQPRGGQRVSEYRRGLHVLQPASLR